MITLAVDAMGGDNAPAIVVNGVKIALDELPELRVILFGDKGQLLPLIKKAALDMSRIELHHTTEAIPNDMKPSHAVRKGKDSSMNLAICAVRDGAADAVVSAGNTGALVALSLFRLRTLPGVDRPVIAGILPGIKGDSIILDMGANSDSTSRNLIESALMGHIYAKVILGVDSPTIGLLNIGEEDLKGNARIKAASSILSQNDLGLNFYGSIEGDDITASTVDVIVTDGFTGNVALKSIEGTVHSIISTIKQQASENTMRRISSKIAMLFAAPLLKALKKRLDPRSHNGAWLLGLNGICVKSHGGTDEYGFYHALKNAYVSVDKKLLEKIKSQLENHQADIWTENEGN